MISKLSILCLFLSVPIGHAQTLFGKVVDAQTKEPLEMVSVYFDNTTIGTVTDEKGEFSINYTDAVQSTLVVSILGYEKTYISDYRSKNNITVPLKESVNELDEVYLEYDDGLTRRQKLELFRDNFLGTSKFGKSCKILNEDAIFLKYDRDDKTLTASSSKSLTIINNSLGYTITYDIVDFDIAFRYANPEKNEFAIKSVTYYGTMFFEELDVKRRKRRINKNREIAYEFSILHFMRALYNKSFKAKGFVFSDGSFKISPYKYLSLSDKDEKGLVTARLTKKMGIHYKGVSSSMYPLAKEFKIDSYGNHYPIKSVLFGGAMGTKRVGDMLPLDFQLDELRN